MKQKRKTGKRANQQSDINRQLCAVRLNPVTSFIRMTLPAGLLFGLHGIAYAGPEGGVVAGGEGSISTPNATTTNITQASQNLIVNWESFNVNSNEVVNFKQPNAQAQALNRIFDQNPSQIFGSVNANGKILLINPNGVFFKPGASVNVGGLVASGLDISNENFMNGNHQYFNSDGSEGGMVVNQGLIQAATGGSVSLIGGAVKNEGTIIATAGQVNLVAGKKVTMDFDGDGLMQFTVDEEILQNAHNLDEAVSNTGTINADGGAVLLKGSAAKDVFTNVVNNSGMIGAARIENKGGVIRLVASGSSNSLINTGTLDASSDSGDGGTVKIYASDNALISEDALITADSTSGKGGTIHVLGDVVALTDTVIINVSGEKGGGETLIGGDYQGKNAAIKNAKVSYVGKDVSIKADAITEGDGGKLIVWADERTYFYSKTSSASGGINSGNGGFAEVSGKEYLDFKGAVDLRAPNGNVGSLLLDPTDITICGGCTTGALTLAAIIQDDGSNPAAADLLDTDLNFQLTLADVTVSASGIGAGTGNITVAGTAAIAGSANQLTLTAVSTGTVTINGAISGVSNLILNSPGGAVTGTGTAAGTGTVSGLTDFNDGTGVSNGVTYSGFVTVQGTGTISNTASYNAGTSVGTSGTIYTNFTSSTATNISGATDFNDGASTTGSYTFSQAVNISGSGTISNTASYDAGTSAATSGDIYTGFTSATATNISGATDFNDTASTTGSYTFSQAANVSGSGTVAAASYDAGTSAGGSGIVYTGFFLCWKRCFYKSRCNY
jgi:filamentous hemagglutinin family protein